MSGIYNKFLYFLKNVLGKIKPKFSFHYVAYTTLFFAVIFSFIHLVSATTPNPGHPWSELGDGVFVFTNSQTSTPYTYTFPAANTTVLTTNAAVTVAQGGTNLTSIASGSILAANSANTLSAVTSTSGTKVLTNTSGTITWETASSGMVYPGSGIPNSTGSAWGTSYSTTGSGTVVALATSPTFSTSIFTPYVIGGTGTTSDLSLQTTSGVGATGADMHFLVGNNGATEAMTILNDGKVGIGTSSPGNNLDVKGSGATTVKIDAGGDASLNLYSGSMDWYLYGNNTNKSLGIKISPGGSDLFTILGSSGSTGQIGIGVSSPTAILHLKAGTAGTAPLKLTSGTNLATPENGAIEYNGTHLYFTTGGTRYQLDQQSGTPSPITIVNSSNLFSTGLTGTGSGVTSSEHSNFFGVDAGNSATSASRSNFFGYNAGNGATSAEDSNFLGGGAGYMAAGAYSSNFLGPSSGHNATSAFESNFFGPSAGVSASNAYYSNFFGSSAGYAASTASNSIFIGQSAGNNDTVDNTTDSDDWSILIGYKTNTGGYKNSVLIGGASSSTPIANTKTNQFMLAPTLTEMRLRGVDYTLPSAQGGASTVLTNNGSGVLSWSSAGSGGMSIGGAITSATQGSILFAGASGVLAQNNTNLNWNDGTSTLTVGGDIKLNGQKALFFNDSDNSNYVAFQSAATVSSNIRWTLPDTDANGCFKSDGSGNMSIGACGDTNEQLFASNGNYTKPTNALMAIVELWGGGGGGGAGYSGAVGTIRSGGAGGGGGSYSQSVVSAAHLSSSIPVTVGAAGTASTTTLGAAMDGGAGGRSCLSSSSSCGGTVYASAYGGAGGNGGSGTGGSGGGGGGGNASAGVTNGTQATGGTGGNPLGAAAGAANSGGGGGGGATAAATGAAGGAAYFGGAGGGSSSSTGAGNSGAGGGSYKGGSGGGAGGTIATAYTLRQGGAGGSSYAASAGGGTAGTTEGAAGGAGAAGVMNGGSGGGGGATGSAVVGGAGGAGGQKGGGGGGGGASNTTSVGSAGGAGGAGYVRIFTLRGAGADLAEVYGSFDDTLSAGDVVALDQEMKAGVKKTSKAYDNGTIGVISTDPGLIIGNIEDDGAEPVLVALSGRVPVKVNMENGPIHKGDYITASSEPGVAMRATKAGTIIGQAMTEYINEDDPGYIVVFIKSGPSNGVALKQILPGLSLDSIPKDDEVIENDQISEEQDNEQEDSNDGQISEEETIQKMALQYFLANKMELSQATEISEIYTDRLSAALEIITPTVITDTISTNQVIASTGEVISFNSPVEFVVPPLFNNDTAGFALIKEGDRRVRVTYKEPYIGEPVVSADLSFNVLDGITDIFAKNIFDDDLKYMIVDSDQEGFTILINKEAPRDLRFSWTALSVKDPQVFESVIEGLIFEEETTTNDTSTDEDVITEGENNSVDTTIDKKDEDTEVIPGDSVDSGSSGEGVPDTIGGGETSQQIEQVNAPPDDSEAVTAEMPATNDITIEEVIN